MPVSYVSLYDTFPEEHVRITDIVPIVGQDGVGSTVWIIKPQPRDRDGDICIGIPLHRAAAFIELFGHAAIALKDAEDAIPH